MDNAIISEDGYVVPFNKIACVGNVKEYSKTRDGKTTVFWKFFFMDVGGTLHQTVRMENKNACDHLWNVVIEGMLK